MLKKASLILLTLSLSACDLHKVTDKNELCAQAKRQEIYNSTSPTYTSNYLMQSQQDQLTAQEKANCAQSSSQ